MNTLLLATIVCMGQTPTLNYELNVKPLPKTSSIRLEKSVDPWKGTAYIQSVGYLKPVRSGNQWVYRSGDTENSLQLSFIREGNEIKNASLTLRRIFVENAPVDCEIQ